jgi:hypothetical protein
LPKIKDGSGQESWATRRGREKRKDNCGSPPAARRKGLDVRELPVLQRREKYFLLTSPFIEPVRLVYYGAVFEIKKEIPVYNPTHRWTPDLEATSAIGTWRFVVNSPSCCMEPFGPLDLSVEDLTAAGTPESPRLTQKKWLFERRLEYARYFFDHHAKQRMSMFNFFLVFVGFALAAYGTLLKDGVPGIAAILAFIAAMLTVFFICLERRNEELVHITEDVLKSLESDVLFSGYNRRISWPKRHKHWWSTKLESDVQLWPLGIFRRQTADEDGQVDEHHYTNDGGVLCKRPVAWLNESKYTVEKSIFEHGRWLPRFQLFIMGMFVFLGILPVFLGIPWIHQWMATHPYLLGLCGFGH